MKVKTPIEFLTFNDGEICIYDTNDDDEIIRSTGKKFRYGDRTIGVQRYYAARQNDIELKKVIHIHRAPWITPENAAVISNTRYKIEQVQESRETNPPVTILSLSQRGIYRGDDDGIS